MSPGPALFGQPLPLIPGNQACYRAILAGAGKTCCGGRHYHQQDHTFVGAAVPHDARRRTNADRG